MNKFHDFTFSILFLLIVFRVEIICIDCSESWSGNIITVPHWIITDTGSGFAENIFFAIPPELVHFLNIKNLTFSWNKSKNLPFVLHDKMTVNKISIIGILVTTTMLIGPLDCQIGFTSNTRLEIMWLGSEL